MHIMERIPINFDDVKNTMLSQLSTSQVVCKSSKNNKYLLLFSFTLVFAKFANFVQISQMMPMFVIQTVPVSIKKEIRFFSTPKEIRSLSLFEWKPELFVSQT